jgi:acetoin utilization deacetylase AcuC-like enzyme
MPVGFAYDPAFLTHQSRFPHPECPERLTAITRKLQQSGLTDRMTPLPLRQAGTDDLLRCHTQSHVDRIRDTARRDVTQLDADTYTNAQSYEAALRAAGSVLQAVDEVVARRVRHAFCAVRPPGHHAESDRAMGFCLFNNVAVGARYAQVRHGMQKIAIVDWDVHHGNGTQQIFYEDDSVVYISLHQYPLYPGSGSTHERGSGKGTGTTLNFPMPAGAGDGDYLDVWDRELVPALRSFGPDLIMVSAGFDAHAFDPLAGMNLTEDGFVQMTRRLLEVSSMHCQYGLISVLEGGYHLEALADSVRAHIEVLADDAP